MKVLLTVFLATICTLAAAMTEIDLTMENYTCHGIRINEQTTQETLSANCKNVRTTTHSQVISGRNPNRIRGGGDQISMMNSRSGTIILTLYSIEFYTDNNSDMVCSFQNEILNKCEIKDSQP